MSRESGDLNIVASFAVHLFSRVRTMQLSSWGTTVAMREIIREGIRWNVREMDSTRVPGARRDRCLIYESEGIIRRVWDFPETWRELSPDELWALVEPRSPAPRPADQNVSENETLATRAATAQEFRAVSETARS